MMDTPLADKAKAPAFTFVGFIHEGVPCAVANLPACVRFYTEVFGLKLLPRPKALDDIGPGAWIGNDENTVQFHLIAKDDELRPGSGAAVAPAGRHTAWRVADIDAFCARMTALGVPWSAQSNLIGEPQVFVQDPEGHTWEFQGMPRAR
jgi:catechol 2,3-dioxygenase-like lactoylglutathione lyase family enzyme